MIRALDRGVGTVLDALRANGLEENTLVIFTSDNGGANYIGLPDINKPVPRLEDDVLRGRRAHAVLREVAGAARRRRQRFDAPVAHVDIFATAAGGRGRARCRRTARSTASTSCRSRAARRRARPHEALFWRSGHYRDDARRRLEAPGLRAPAEDVAVRPGERSDRAARPRRASAPTRWRSCARILDAHDAQMVAPAWPSLIEGADRDRPPARRPRPPDDEYVYWAN